MLSLMQSAFSRVKTKQKYLVVFCLKETEATPVNVVAKHCLFFNKRYIDMM